MDNLARAVSSPKQQAPKEDGGSVVESSLVRLEGVTKKAETGLVFYRLELFLLLPPFSVVLYCIQNSDLLIIIGFI